MLDGIARYGGDSFLSRAWKGGNIMNDKEKAKFRRRLNAYARDRLHADWNVRVGRYSINKDILLRRRADRLIDDIYEAGHYQGTIADYEGTGGKG